MGCQPLTFVFQTFGQVNRAFVGVLRAVEQRFDREAVQVGVEAFFDEPIGLLHAVDHGAVLAGGPLRAGGLLGIFVKSRYDLENADVGGVLGQTLSLIHI